MAHQLSPGPGFLGQELNVPWDVSLVFLPLTFIPLWISRGGHTWRQQHLVTLPQATLIKTHPVWGVIGFLLPHWLQFLYSVCGSFLEVSGMLFCGENPCTLPEGQHLSSLSYLPMPAPQSKASVIFSMVFHSNVHIYAEVKPTSSNGLHERGRSFFLHPLNPGDTSLPIILWFKW